MAAMRQNMNDVNAIKIAFEISARLPERQGASSSPKAHANVSRWLWKTEVFDLLRVSFGVQVWV